MTKFKQLFSKKERQPSVMWGIPCDELGYSKFWTKFVQSAEFLPGDKFAFTEGTYLEKSRNIIHSEFVKSDCSYLMMLDSDILFPPKLLSTLMAHNLPVVGGWYRDKKSKEPTVYKFLEDKDGVAIWEKIRQPGRGLERVDGMGAGCWLMSKETALALGEEPYGSRVAGGGEDMILCRKLIELKIPLHVDWGVNCAHIGVGYV